MARQKRARLQAGKGVKKNGVYIQSDQAASFESLPPGPDANTIAKDIHHYIPRLNKKGTLFRPSQATIEQRGQEFKALMHALFQDDVPMLVQELRDTRLVRDFFGYWRRDVDHDRKRQSLSVKDRHTSRQSVSSSAFSMYFSASNISLQLPSPYADLPPSPALPSNPQSPRSPDSSRRNSSQSTERRRSGGAGPSSYATSDSSASTVSVGSSSHGGLGGSGAPHSLPSSPQDMTFYVSTRGSLALSLAQDEYDDARAEYINTPLSAPARVQPPHPHPWARDPDRPFAAHDEEILLPDPAALKARPDAGTIPTTNTTNTTNTAAPGEFQPGLQALPEDGELVPVPMPMLSPVSPHSEIEEVPRVPVRRMRNNSCPDRANRQCLIFPPDAPHSAHPGHSNGGGGGGGFLALDELHLRAGRPLSRDGGGEPRTPTTTTSSSSGRSSHAFSTFSSSAADGASRRSSWRTSMMSEASTAQSFTSSFANGSCADFDRQSRLSFATSFADGSCADLSSSGSISGFSGGSERDPRLSVASFASASTSGGRQTALGHRASMATLSSFLSDLSIDSGAFSRVLTPAPPPGAALRRSLSAGSRRPASIMAALDGREEWDEQQEDFIDAYFYGELNLPYRALLSLRLFPIAPLSPSSRALPRGLPP